MITTRAAATVLLAAAFLTGCSSGSTEAPTAEQQVCSARADLKTAYDKVVSDVTSANFGDAKASLAAVKTAVDDLVTAEQSLAAEKRAAIEPQVAALRTTIEGLGSASTAAELGAGLTTARTQFTAVLDTVATTVNCT